MTPVSESFVLCQNHQENVKTYHRFQSPDGLDHRRRQPANDHRRAQRCRAHLFRALRHHRVRGLQRHPPKAGQGQHDADQHVAHARPSQERFQGPQHNEAMKAIRLKQKGKEPMVFNTNDKLAEYLNIRSDDASHILSIKNEYERLLSKYDIESIEETDEFIIPQHYIDQGFKRIDVPGKFIYIANKDGKIINVANDRELKPLYKGQGDYLYVALNGYRKTVHRIIATLFVPNPLNLPIVNHINEFKTDNRAENLEWCDNKYNCNYGSFKKKCVSDGAPIKIKSIKDGEEMIYQSINEASRQTGVDTKSIRECCRKKRKSAKGFSFSYA